MNNNEPNKIVSALYKEFNNLRKVKDINLHDYKREEELKTQLAAITRVVGAIEVMSKGNILKLCRMASCLRFMEPFKFLIQLDKGCQDYHKENN